MNNTLRAIELCWNSKKRVDFWNGQKTNISVLSYASNTLKVVSHWERGNFDIGKFCIISSEFWHVRSSYFQ